MKYKVGDKLIHKCCKLSYEIIEINDKTVTVKALHDFSWNPKGTVDTYEINWLKQYKLIKERINLGYQLDYSV